MVGRWIEIRGSALLAAISSCSTDGFSNNFPHLLRLPAMSLIAHRSQWVRCSNRHFRATVAVMERMTTVGLADGILLLLVLWALGVNPAPEGPEPGLGNPSEATTPRSPFGTVSE